MDFDEGYFSKRHDGRAWLNGNKPLHYWRWRRYFRSRGISGRLLDYGYGEGYFLHSVQSHFKTYGVDIAAYAVAMTRQRVPQARVHLVEGENLPFPANLFDAVTAFDVLEHIPDPLPSAIELYRVTKPGGLLLVTTPNLASLGRRWKGPEWQGYRDETHCSLWSRKRWVELLEEAGYHVVDRFYDGLWDSPYWPRIPALLQHLLFRIPATVLFGAGVRFPSWGETLVLVGRKEEAP